MEKFTSKQERLMEKARDLKNKVLKRVTALQVFRGVKKGGKQLIKDSDRVVIFKMENGQEFITNGYFMIKKGYDKAMDEMLVKFADKVVVMEQKMKTFYTGCESDYAMVTNADVRVFNTLLTTEKTTMITKNDSMDTYHAYMNSYYYRYFEKKVNKMGISGTVHPVVMFDDKNEFVGCILPIRMTLEGKKEFENTLTLEEFNEGEKLIKEYRETLLVEIIEGNTDECLEQAVADTERRKKEFDGFIASELKVIKNIDGYYEVGYELEGINKLYTHISVYGTRDYGHYDYFLNKPDTKRLAERMLEKIQKELEKNIIEKVENEMEMKKCNKADVAKAMIELGKFLKEQKRTEEEIQNKIWDIFPNAQEIDYRKEDESVSFIAGVEYVGAKPTKNTMLEIDENFARVESMDGLMFNIYQEEDKIKMSADVMVTYVDKWGMDYEYDVVIKEHEVEIPRCKEMVTHMYIITEVIEEFECTVKNILVNIQEENSIGAIIENKEEKLQTLGLYAGADGGKESKVLAKMLADYYKVEIIDANGVDIDDLEEKEKEVEIKTIDDVDTTLPIGTTVGFRYDEYENDMLVEKKILTGKIVYIFGDYAGKYNVKTNDGNIHLVHNSDIVTWEEPVEKEEKILEQLSELASPEEILATADELGLPSLDEEVSPEPTAEDVTEWQGLESKKCKYCEGENFIKEDAKLFKCEHCFETQPIEEKDELDILIEEFDETVEEIEQLEINQAIGMEVDKKLLEKLNRKLFKIQCAIEKTGKVYIVRHTSRVLDTPDSIAIFRELEQAKQFMKSSEKTLEILGLFTNEHGRLIPVDEDEEKLIPEIKEIAKRLDGIAKDVEIYDGYYDYTLKNGCTLRLFTDETNPIGIALEIFDSNDMFYMRKVGDKKIHEYIDKIENAQDVLVYEKYGLDDYIDCETGNVVIDVKDMKNKGNIFGTPLEEVIDKLLKENKEFDMKLFNENYIKEPHYMIFRKGEIKNE